MPRIVWDKLGEHYFETGTDHGVIYKQKGDGTYGTGVAWNGLTAVTDSPGGAEPTDFYADNIKYASLRSAETWNSTVEAYTYPPEFAECDGTRSPVKGVYVGQQPRTPFGFVYRTLIGSDTLAQGDEYKLHLCYNCSASPSEKGYSTVNDSPDAVTFSWELTSNPVETGVDGMKPASTVVIDSRDFKEDGAAKLKALEDMLFGSDSAEPKLPDVKTVLETLGWVATISAPAGAPVATTKTSTKQL